MLSNWCVNSYFKTEQKLEWFVVPLIVVLAFAFGLLQSVFLGIAISTFIFVASFCKYTLLACSIRINGFLTLISFSMVSSERRR
jgi:hypothetical protein